MPPANDELRRGSSATERILARCDQLAQLTDTPGGVSRSLGKPALDAALRRVDEWMTEAGMSTRRDAFGNLIGTYSGDGRLLLIGSHLDTVPNGGKYDGALGVLAGLACVEQLASEAAELSVGVAVVAFAEEEGQFGKGCLGSRAFVGQLGPDDLRLRDATGLTVAQALTDGGADPLTAVADPTLPHSAIAYVELHIEQGRALERLNLPVGVVDRIFGQTRVRVGFAGRAGHAGTTPMSERRDAACAAAEFTLAVEATARVSDGLLGTVGMLRLEPGADNVIPGRAELMLDLRHASDDLRRKAFEQLSERARSIVRRRGLALEWSMTADCEAVALDTYLVDLLSEATQREGVRPHRLASGAGHDAAVLASELPAAMLFVRCQDGVSHHPAEAVSTRDVDVAVRTLVRFLEAFDQAEARAS